MGDAIASERTPHEGEAPAVAAERVGVPNAAAVLGASDGAALDVSHAHGDRPAVGGASGAVDGTGAPDGGKETLVGRAYVALSRPPDAPSVAPSTTESALALTRTQAPTATFLARLGARGGPELVLPAYLAARACPKSRRTMQQALDRAARLMGASDATAVPWHALRFEHTDTIRARLLEKGYSRETIGSTLTALRGVLRQARRMGHMTADDFQTATEWDALKTPDRPPPGRELTQEELDKIAAYCDHVGGAYGSFLEALFALLLGTGLRAAEACILLPSAFEATTRIIHVRRKGGKLVELPLGDAEGYALETWMNVRAGLHRLRKDDPLLVRVYNNDSLHEKHALNTDAVEYLCETVAKEAGVAPFTPHDLRRTFATRALRFADLATVQWFMSHSDPKTTKRYDRRKIDEYARERKRWSMWRS